MSCIRYRPTTILNVILCLFPIENIRSKRPLTRKHHLGDHFRTLCLCRCFDAIRIYADFVFLWSIDFLLINFGRATPSIHMLFWQMHINIHVWAVFYNLLTLPQISPLISFNLPSHLISVWSFVHTHPQMYKGYTSQCFPSVYIGHPARLKYDLTAHGNPLKSFKRKDVYAVLSIICTPFYIRITPVLSVESVCEHERWSCFFLHVYLLIPYFCGSNCLAEQVSY